MIWYELGAAYLLAALLVALILTGDKTLESASDATILAVVSLVWPVVLLCNGVYLFFAVLWAVNVELRAKGVGAVDSLKAIARRRK